MWLLEWLPDNSLTFCSNLAFPAFQQHIKPLINWSMSRVKIFGAKIIRDVCCISEFFRGDRQQCCRPSFVVSTLSVFDLAGAPIN